MKYLYVVLSLVLISACSKPSLKNEFSCGNVSYEGVKLTQDFEKNFKISFPEKWKVELAKEDSKSIIRYQDTLTKMANTTLIQVSFMKVHSRVNKKFAEAITLDIKKMEYQEMELLEIKSKLTKFDDKPVYYNLSETEPGKEKLTLLNVFTESSNGMLHVEAQIYGTKLVDERICKIIDAISKVEYLE